MGEDGRRLVGYRVRLDRSDRGLRSLYSLGPGVSGAITDAAKSKLYKARVDAMRDIVCSPYIWQESARIVRVYRRRKAGAK